MICKIANRTEQLDGHRKQFNSYISILTTYNYCKIVYWDDQKMLRKLNLKLN